MWLQAGAGNPIIRFSVLRRDVFFLLFFFLITQSSFWDEGKDGIC